MESANETRETKTKSIFELDSDEESHDNEGDSGLAVSLEASPSHTNKNDVSQDAVEVDFDSRETAHSEDLQLSEVTENPVGTKSSLSAFQKAKIERNRQKALLLRQARLQAHPYKNGKAGEEHSVIRVQNSRLIDSGGGFLIDEKDLEEEQSREIVITEIPAPIILPDRPHCDECEQPLHDSLLYRSFSFPVCDTCKDANDDKYSLITRTDARQEYLLKDCDLDLREPILRFILRKNPLNPRWGDMKLYLRLQVEKRALELWETLEKIEEEKELREAKREKSKTKKFNQQVKNLRMAVRSSVYKKVTESHQHVFGAEQFDAERDIYYRKCSTCSFQQEYEKM
uniref:XPA C-terminal domain-containing protein n=1 Tax=Daphnia galeata TaxID=27404 RepID=A0A8J2RF70_9CRUS|nr:unnamed protein product [Daphnia galeata]